MSWFGLGHKQESRFTDQVEQQLRQGESDLAALNYIFPSKKRYRHFRGEGTWLKVVLAHPGAAFSKSSSKWCDVDSLSRWGWTSEVSPAYEYGDADGVGDLVAACQGREYQWCHTKEAYPEDGPKGIRYPASFGMYVNIFFPEKGVIIGAANFGPQYMVKEEKTPAAFLELWKLDTSKLPELQRWSDVVFLTWKKETNEEQRANLNKIVCCEVMNTESRNMLAYVLRMNFKKDKPLGRAPRWPDKRVIDSKMEGFNALLYTPNLRGIVWLLVQHRDELGKKTIGSITVFEPNHGELVYKPTFVVDIVPR